jgi:RNA polymerase sigma-70 factor (ECF subfamily)
LPAALAGDPAAFEALTEPYRRELLAHCYRILGSLEDAEDLLQETLLRAWKSLNTYEGRASLRAWLYKIATNACLDALARRPRRGLPPDLYPQAKMNAPFPAPLTEPVWLEPFPDELLAPAETTPEARIESRESISLSFLAALQALSPRQRCVLILSDVLDWHAEELSDMLGASLSSVNSLLHRARLTLKKAYPADPERADTSLPTDPKTRALLDHYLQAWESADVDEIISLLIEDTTFAMPPLPFWVRGPAAIRSFISSAILDGTARGRWRLLPLRANGEPAFAWYRKNDGHPGYQAYAIQVVTITGERIAAITTFLQPALFRFFNLPGELPV